MIENLDSPGLASLSVDADNTYSLDELRSSLRSTFTLDERGERVFMESAVYPMSKRILDSPAEELFNHISKLCASFIKRFKLQDQKLPVALVSSFPCRHESLRQAKLIRWTKGVKSEGAKVTKKLKELQIQFLNLGQRAWRTAPGCIEQCWLYEPRSQIYY